MPELAWDGAAGCPGMTRAVGIWGFAQCSEPQQRNLLAQEPLAWGLPEGNGARSSAAKEVPVWGAVSHSAAFKPGRNGGRCSICGAAQGQVG